MAVATGSSERLHLDAFDGLPEATPAATAQDPPSLRRRERTSLLKNRMREICTSGSVRGGDGNIPAYSAQRMAPDQELTRIIANDHRPGQQAVRLDRAPERALGGDAHRVRRDSQRGDAQPLKMGLPGRPIQEGVLRTRGQSLNERPR